MTHPQLKAVADRTTAFCVAANLKESAARPVSTLRWLDRFTFPIGFDHTKTFYSAQHKIHLCITEPYNSTDWALESLRELAAKRGNRTFSFAVAPEGTGLWFPGSCFPLLVCREGYDDWLNQIALLLPRAQEAA
jgi:hypothetical protein